jgi:hypothetical protein
MVRLGFEVTDSLLAIPMRSDVQAMRIATPTTVTNGNFILVEILNGFSRHSFSCLSIILGDVPYI